MVVEVADFGRREDEGGVGYRTCGVIHARDFGNEFGFQCNNDIEKSETLRI